MDKRESMWDVYLKKGMSRRSFIKGCVALTSVMGLSTDMLSKVVEAAEAKRVEARCINRAGNKEGWGKGRGLLRGRR